MRQGWPAMDRCMKSDPTFERQQMLCAPCSARFLGHQILALALGIPTYKMNHGHRGINHPVKNLVTGKCEITSQNHGFCVDPEVLGQKSDLVEVTHINLNDDTIEGIRVKNQPAYSVQYHPEAAPGPLDAHYLFDQFLEELTQYKKA